MAQSMAHDLLLPVLENCTPHHQAPATDDNSSASGVRMFPKSKSARTCESMGHSSVQVQNVLQQACIGLNSAAPPSAHTTASPPADVCGPPHAIRSSSHHWKQCYPNIFQDCFPFRMAALMKESKLERKLFRKTGRTVDRGFETLFKCAYQLEDALPVLFCAHCRCCLLCKLLSIERGCCFFASQLTVEPVACEFAPTNFTIKLAGITHKGWH